ncbi:VOC family protein [Lentzea flava]|uniref:Glyoxalase n=1 Tax=Lentzea flava TaxID=103732 RepID=A0ABQ2UBR4_9PSEU|nr:VOC family protein [Lentzea flava]MCP2197379.1 Glyoxalase-like domain [Lentzea flava]GGU19302.1 glyoxalase [Lentzea flava]
MTSIIHNISVDARDAYAVASWWSQVLDLPMHPDDNPGDPECLIQLPNGIRYLFINVPEDKSVKNRMHLCLQPADVTRDEEVERLLGIGATVYEDHRKADGTGWVTMRDPEGNEFCVERSAAERAATS